MQHRIGSRTGRSGAAAAFAIAITGAAVLAMVALVARPRIGKVLRKTGLIEDLILAAPALQQPGEGPLLPVRPLVKPHRLDAWSIIGPGGGGTFYFPAISPHDPKLVGVSTDMTQCFLSEDGGVTWREFNLRFTCRLTFDPKRPERIYALARGAGLWRSDDRGHTWSLIYPDPAAAYPIYMDDEAETYLLTGRVYPQPMSAFAIDPEDSDTLYGVTTPNLLISRDAGKHWSRLAAGVAAAQYLFVDPGSPRGSRRLFTALGNTTGVWDGSKYTGGIKVPGSSWCYGVAFGAAPGKPAVLYTANDYVVKEGEFKGGGILASEDGGLTWRSLNEGLLKLVAKGTYPEFSAVATSLHHPEVIYASFYHLNLSNDPKRYYGVVKTTDGGVTWSLVRHEFDLTAPNMHDSWISARFGPDFGDQPLSIGVDDHNPDLVYTTDLGRVMRSTDGGKNWEAVYSQATPNGYTTTGLDVTTCYGIHFDPFNPKRVFISYTDIGLFRSEDGGESWQSATAKGVPRRWQNTTYWAAFDPAVKDKMWAAMSRVHDLPRFRMFRARAGATAQFQGGVVVSTDGGRSWAVAGRGLPEMAATDIVVDPKSSPSARVLYVTGFGRGVFKSADGGQTWTAKNQGLPPVEPLTWRMAMDRDGILYVVTIRGSQDGNYGNDQDGWLFRSRDGAETWEKVALPAGLNGPVGITPDPQDPSRLYLAAWGRYKLYATGLAPQDGGVFLSTDGGIHWRNVLSACRRIYDVTVDPRDTNLVYAAGFEAGAWRSTDRGEHWIRISGFNFKDAHRVIPDPQDRTKIYITTFGSSVWHGPAAGDPQAAEDIVAPPAMRFGAKN